MLQPSMRGRHAPVKQVIHVRTILEKSNETKITYPVKDITLRRIQRNIHKHPDEVQRKNLLNEAQSVLHTIERNIQSGSSFEDISVLIQHT